MYNYNNKEANLISIRGTRPITWLHLTSIWSEVGIILIILIVVKICKMVPVNTRRLDVVACVQTNTINIRQLKLEAINEYYRVSVVSKRLNNKVNVNFTK